MLIGRSLAFVLRYNDRRLTFKTVIAKAHIGDSICGDECELREVLVFDINRTLFYLSHMISLDRYCEWGTGEDVA